MGKRNYNTLIIFAELVIMLSVIALITSLFYILKNNYS